MYANGGSLKMVYDFEDKLDEIRVNLYEKSKNLSREEFVRQLNERAQIIANQYGLTIIASPDAGNAVGEKLTAV